MRDLLARTTAVALLVLVASLAGLFAWRQNSAPGRAQAPEGPGAVPLQPAVDAELAARGRDVYVELSCDRCHAVAGEGNPRHPLDGVGARRSRAAIREWITASGSAREGLTRSVIRAKEGFGQRAAGELDALVEYVASLR